LIAELDVRAVVAFLDLVVITCSVQLTLQQKLAGSRWHVMGDVAREGKVLYATG
jgi:hypothetical protein